MTAHTTLQSYREDHPLREGLTLLEASAGTGKTYSVTFLYLRLLLERGLQPSEIVVVTFTRAAAAELRDRIHARIADAEQRVKEIRDNIEDNDDPEVIKLKGILARATVGDPLLTLQNARASLDTSAISTIHKFAGRLSDEFAMVTGTPSQATLVESLDAPLDEALRDLEHQLAEAFPAECEVIARLGDSFHTQVRRLAKQILDDPDVQFLPEYLLYESAAPTVQKLQDQQASAGLEQTPNQQLVQTMQALAKRLLAGELDACSQWFADIRKAKAIDGRKISDRAVSPRLEKLRQLCQRVAELHQPQDIEQEVLTRFKAEKGAAELLKYFSFDFLSREHKNFRGDTSATPTVEQIPELSRDIDQLIDLDAFLSQDVFQQVWIQRVAHKAAALVNERTAILGLRSHTHIISDVVVALESAHKEALVRAVSGRYKAALIDEFQDTDERQWAIFKQLFGDQAAITYLIGDPKQAIYGFRGANVAVYEGVRDSLPAERIMTLETNYRSDLAYNSAVNGIFAVRDRTAVSSLENTPAASLVSRYLEVKSPEREPAQRMMLGDFELNEAFQTARHAVTNGRTQSAMVLRAVSDVTQADYLSWSAQNLAKEIVQLLKNSDQNQLYIDKEKAWRAIQPEDCAVIVRSGREAQTVVAALRAVGVPAVARDQQSVALSPAANALLHWLAAIDTPTHNARIRAFLCSPLVGLHVDEIDALDDEVLTSWTSFFDGLKKSWWRTGLHAALRDTLHRSVFATGNTRPLANAPAATPSVASSVGTNQEDGESRDNASNEGDQSADVMSRLLSRPNGSRVAADLMHLAEVLNVAQRDERLSPRGLSDWFSRRRHEEENGDAIDDRFKRRIESDAKAVEVVTAHSSKGLEYNLVWMIGLTEGEHAPSFLVHPERPTQRFGINKEVYKRLTDTAALDVSAAQEAGLDLEAYEHDRRNAPAFLRAQQWLQNMQNKVFPSLLSPLLAPYAPTEHTAPFSLHAAVKASEDAAVNEDLRLLYVALTRARMRSVVYLGAMKKEAGELLLSLSMKKGEHCTPNPNGVGRLERTSPWNSSILSIEQWFPNLDDPKQISYRALDFDHVRSSMEERHPPEVRSTRNHLQSFSSLVRELPDHFAHFNADDSSEFEHLVVPENEIPTSSLPLLSEDGDLARDAQTQAAAYDKPVDHGETPLPLAKFSSGTEAGTALHTVFEEVDFVGAATEGASDSFTQQLREIVNRALVRNGLEPQKDGDALTHGVLAVLQTPIGGILANTRLADISRKDRIDELEFHMPLGESLLATSSRAIFDVLQSRRGDPAIADSWIDDLSASRAQAIDLNGMLTGFIDLVFRREINGEPHYFIADYKSNRLVPSGENIVPSAFHKAALIQEMARHHYYLQYHIYLLALHRWLSSRLPSYDYDKHIGGAYYFFVRGMSGADTPVHDGYARGVFFDRPSREVIEALDQAFQRASAVDAFTEAQP